MHGLLINLTKKHSNRGAKMFALMSGVRQLGRGNKTIYKFKFVDESETEVAPVDLIDLSGYEIAEAVDDLADTDTLLEALGKIEARLVTLESA
jgi:hypothetical protein